jgi:hypothetical protein
MNHLGDAGHDVVRTEDRLAEGHQIGNRPAIARALDALDSVEAACAIANSLSPADSSVATPTTSSGYR